MDRNLGASQAANSPTDSQAYGDLFQWGRLNDGHQSRSSTSTTTLSANDNPGHSKFITNASGSYDWRSSQNNNLWQGATGINNPCPSGWRLPNKVELQNELNSWSPINSSGAYSNPLKWTIAGYREPSNAFDNVGSIGYYWSFTMDASNYPVFLNIDGSSAYVGTRTRASGLSVRCIKD